MENENPIINFDLNGDGDTNVGVAVYLIVHKFNDGPAPVEACCQ